MEPAAASAEPAPPPPSSHAKKPSVDELFDNRWKTAYEVRTLERESLQAKGQAGSRCGSASSLASACTAGPPAGQQAAPQPTAAPGQAAPLRQQEVIDDDDELAPSSAPPACQQQAPRQEASPAAAGEQEEEEEGEAEPEVKFVWDSSSRRPGAAAQPAVAPAPGTAAQAALELKERGNALLKAGQCLAAVECYSEALALCLSGGGRAGAKAKAPPAKAGKAGAAAAADRQLLATLYSNRAHCLNKLQQYQQAAEDATVAHRLHPTWPKPLARLATAHLGLGQWAAAVAACKLGDQLSPKSSEGHTDFTPLLDRAAVHAAAAGSLAGFDGAQLEVRSAGEEAWLGGPAPHVPELDGPLDEDAPAGAGPTLALPPPGGPGAAAAGVKGSSSALALAAPAGAPVDPLVAWDYRRTTAAGGRRRTSFRSIKEAVAAARDGDRILLRRGVHNGMGESITLTKRLLIEGEGRLGEATIDQRANAPTFRIARGGVVLRNLDLDQTGFREALLVDGPFSVQPLIAGCAIRCSGDDAINTAGAAAPTFLRCTLTAKKVGLKAYGSSAPVLQACAIEQCGEQGLRAQEAAAPALHGCTIAECKEEACVAMDSARLTLQRCSLRACAGPGVDLSGGASAAIAGGSIAACVGGVWLWDRARAELRGADVAGGASHALLVDGAASVEARETTVRGLVHATEVAWPGLLRGSNRLLDPEGPTDFPPEEGPFRFVPNRFTRKQ